MAEEIEIRGWNCKTESIIISQWLALWCQEGGEVKEFIKIIIYRLQRKNTEIFIERIFTVILQIEKREEKLKKETICWNIYSPLWPYLYLQNLVPKPHFPYLGKRAIKLIWNLNCPACEIRPAIHSHKGANWR